MPLNSKSFFEPQQSQAVFAPSALVYATMCRRTVPLEFSCSSLTSTSQPLSISGWTWAVLSSQPARTAAPFLAVQR